MNTSYQWQPPSKPDELPITETVWPRFSYALFLMATSGRTLRYELEGLVNAKFQMKPSTIGYVFRRLEKLAFVERTKLKVVRKHSLIAIRLSETGRAFCEKAGWEIIENEWERLDRLHSGSDQPKHTAAVLSVAYHARLRGWQTQVVPDSDDPNVYPDLLIEKDGVRHYVEVELRHGKLKKWRNVQAFQGHVALCAKTCQSRTTLAGECQKLNIPVIATDLLSLAQTHKNPDPGPLWLQSWGMELPE